MVNDSGGTTIGVWIGERDDTLSEFDAALECGPTHIGSRSEEIKHAMAMLATIEETLDDVDYSFDAEPSKRHFVRQAILDRARKEAAMD
jgi:hypothetical protein